jgi:hypothetical protein
MLIPFSMIVLGTQLVMTVADGVPKFDIARGCRVDSTQAFDLSVGLNETVKRCVADEQQALTQLQTQWSQFLGSDKAQCTGSQHWRLAKLCRPPDVPPGCEIGQATAEAII